jgi:hypothetical protein
VVCGVVVVVVREEGRGGERGLDGGVCRGAVWSHIRRVIANVIDNHRVRTVMSTRRLAAHIRRAVVLTGKLTVRV